MFTLIFLILTCISILIFIIYEKNSENKSESQIKEKEKKNQGLELKINDKEIAVNNNNNNNNCNKGLITNYLELQMIDNMKKLTSINSKEMNSSVQAILPNLDSASVI